MGYIDDKLDVIFEDSRKKREDDGLPRATLTQLCKRWGCKGGTYWMIEKKAPPELHIYDIDGKVETWTLNGEQVGTPYKNKQYKMTSKSELKPG